MGIGGRRAFWAAVMAISVLACCGTASSAASTLKWSAATAIDSRAPFSDPATFYSTSCPSASLCFAGGPNHFYVSHDPGARRSWVTLPEPLDEIDTLACPTASLCVALSTETGKLATSGDPAAQDPAWYVARLSPHYAPFAVSCPSRGLCVSLTAHGGIYSSTDPTGGARAWKLIQLGQRYSPAAIACPTKHLCVAAEDKGSRHDIAMSTDPTGGGAAWHLTRAPRLPRMEEIVAISCPSISLCVGATNGGHIVSTTDPLGGRWRVTKIPTATQLDTISCASATSCFAGDESGSGVSSSAPGAGRWRRSHAPGLDDVTCPSSSVCVGVEQGGGPLTASRAPATGRWHEATVNGSSNILGLACPTSSECVAIDDEGKILSSADPQRGAGAWRALNFGIGIDGSEDEPGNSGDIVCPSASLCVTGNDGEVLLSHKPLGPASAWQSTDGLDDETNSVADLSCPSVAFCMVLDAEETAGGEILSSSTPSARAHAWVSSMWPSDYLGPVACASSALCLVGDGQSATLYATVDPGATAPSWSTIRLQKRVTSLACPSLSLCVGTDSGGAVVSSTQPTVAASWTRTMLAGGAGSSISCPTESFCATAGGDAVSYSNDPAAGTGWTRQAVRRVGPIDLDAISCASAQFCAASGRDGETTIGKP